jgi:hypothetical protein
MYLPLKPKTISSKIIYLDCPTLLSLRKKGLLAQAPPLDFPVHPYQTDNYVLIKTWKENNLEPAWGRTVPGPADHRNSCPDCIEGVDSSHTGKKKKAPSPDQKKQWTMLTHPGDTRVTLKRL